MKLHCTVSPLCAECQYTHANQMCVCVDGTANIRCAICEWYAYHSPRTKICWLLREHKGNCAPCVDTFLHFCELHFCCLCFSNFSIMNWTEGEQLALIEKYRTTHFMGIFRKIIFSPVPNIFQQFRNVELYCPFHQIFLIPFLNKIFQTNFLN